MKRLRNTTTRSGILALAICLLTMVDPVEATDIVPGKYIVVLEPEALETKSDEDTLSLDELAIGLLQDTGGT